MKKAICRSCVLICSLYGTTQLNFIRKTSDIGLYSKCMPFNIHTYNTYMCSSPAVSCMQSGCVYVRGPKGP